MPGNLKELFGLKGVEVNAPLHDVTKNLGDANRMGVGGNGGKPSPFVLHKLEELSERHYLVVDLLQPVESKKRACQRAHEGSTDL
jgi:hypothetical protein